MTAVKIPWILTRATFAIPTYHTIYNYSCSYMFLSLYSIGIPSDSAKKSKLKAYSFVWVYFIHDLEYNILTLEQHCSTKSVGLFLECILVHFLTVGCKSLILASQDLCRLFVSAIQ